MALMTLLCCAVLASAGQWDGWTEGRATCEFRCWAIAGKKQDLCGRTSFPLSLFCAHANPPAPAKRRRTKKAKKNQPTRAKYLHKWHGK